MHQPGHEIFISRIRLFRQEQERQRREAERGQKQKMLFNGRS